MKRFFYFTFGLLSFALRAAGGEGADIDSRLGPPFAQRPRATLGSETASVVVIEFSSFRCTHCRVFHDEVFPKLRAQYIDTGKVQWVIVHASNQAADQASPLFLAARGALQQERYWSVAPTLYVAGLGPASTLAKLLTETPPTGGAALAASLQDAAVREAVAADFADYAKLGLRGTPTFLLRKLGRDGKWSRGIIEDTQPLSYFQRTLDGMLARP